MQTALRQVKTRLAGAISALLDCLERTDWHMFREAVTDGDSTNWKEFSKCIDHVERRQEHPSSQRPGAGSDRTHLDKKGRYASMLFIASLQVYNSLKVTQYFQKT